ncbi:hypothetical protein DERP_002060 [Dermatophagoides pteronyssinus]|uniref:Uncharacterized protein n=1 Tax=Dermatophagoides pteronyssinus TaxID=6956 RepID=A0ABQ8JH41_DERPT|nr:hypothetical protein DERP_002060 [Dermatophagoides pteronyssinus]
MDAPSHLVAIPEHLDKTFNIVRSARRINRAGPCTEAILILLCCEASPIKVPSSYKNFGGSTSSSSKTA